MVTISVPEPNYLSSQAATQYLTSDSKLLTSLSTPSLNFLNGLIDELLHLTIHNSLLFPSSPSSASINFNPGEASLAGGGLGLGPILTSYLLNPNEVLTNQQIKSGFLKVITHSRLSKSAILEAEIALRSLLREGVSASSGSLSGGGSLHSDPSLLNPSSSNSRTEGGGGTGRKVSENSKQVEEIFKSLRESIFQISGFSSLSSYNSTTNGTKSNTSSSREVGGKKLFKESLRIGLLLERSRGDQQVGKGGGGGHVRFLNSFYTERILSTVLETLLKTLSKYLETSEDFISKASLTGELGKRDGRTIELEDLESAFKEEEDLIWSWLSSLRIRSVLSSSSSSAYNSRKIVGNRMIPSGMVGVHGGGGGGSIDSIGSSTALIYRDFGTSNTGGNMSRSRSDNGTRGKFNENGGNEMVRAASEDGFENLMKNNETKKFSLTPNRLKVADRFARSPSSNSFTSISPSPSSTSFSNIPTTFISPSPRLQPRTAVALSQTLEEESTPEELDEDEGSDQLMSSNRRRRRELKPKESLMDLLNSEPPSWVNNQVGEEKLPVLPGKSIISTSIFSNKSRETSPDRTRTNTSRRKLSISKRKGSISIPTTTSILDSSYLSSPPLPTSTAMKSDKSNSSIQSFKSGMSSTSSNGRTGVTNSSSQDPEIETEEKLISTTRSSNGTRLKAKDERGGGDLASIKRANEDLVAFLSSPPPPPLSSSLAEYDPFRTDAEVNGFNSLRKKNGLMRGFISKIGGGGGGAGKKGFGESENEQEGAGVMGRATSTITRSLGRKTSKLGLLNDLDSSLPPLPTPRTNLKSNTFSTPISTTMTRKPNPFIETTPPSPTSTSSHSTIMPSTTTSPKPPDYSIPNFSRSSPVVVVRSTLGTSDPPISNSMNSSKSLDSTSSPHSINKVRPIYSSEEGSIGLATISKRAGAGAMRSLSVGNLDITTSSSPVKVEKLASSDLPSLSSNIVGKESSPPGYSLVHSTKISTPIMVAPQISPAPSTTPTTFNKSPPPIVEIPTPLVLATPSTIIATPNNSSPSPRSSLTFNRNRRESTTSTILSTTTNGTGGGGGGGNVHDAQTNFKPVPLQILNSSIFSTPSTNEKLATVMAVGAGVVVSTASVVKLARSSSSRVKVTKSESTMANSNSDGTPSPTSSSSSLVYLTSTPEEESELVVVNEKEEEADKGEGKKIDDEGESEKEEEEKLSVSSEQNSISTKEVLVTPKVAGTIEHHSIVPRREEEDLQVTLVNLKNLMKNLTTPLECITLLEQFMLKKKEEEMKEDEVEVHRSILPKGIPVLVKEADLMEFNEKSEALLVEFFLSGGDLPSSSLEQKMISVPEVEEVANEVHEKERKEEENEDVEVEEEEEELKMPGGM